MGRWYANVVARKFGVFSFLKLYIFSVKRVLLEGKVSVDLEMTYLEEVILKIQRRCMLKAIAKLQFWRSDDWGNAQLKINIECSLA